MLALVCLGHAVVPVEVVRLGQRQLLEDLFGPLKLVGLQRVEAVVPPVEAVVFRERADVREFTPQAAEMLFQGGWRGTLAKRVGVGDSGLPAFATVLQCIVGYTLECQRCACQC